VRRIQRELFSDRPGGLPGNDDAGALSSWNVFSALGLYPAVPAVAGFVVGSPLFPNVTVALPGGRVLRIEGAGAAANAPFVQSLAIDGRPWLGPWVPWSAVSRGATLHFVLGEQPSQWGTGRAAAPASFDQRTIENLDTLAARGRRR
jgi:putative alpha-1,2-mannosidase